MIVVIFELKARDGAQHEYLSLAAELKPLLNEIPGFISIERFQSLSDPNKLLSLSFWEDEKAIEEWRNIEAHRMAQHKGRLNILQEYQLSVANVNRSYGMHDRKTTPEDSYNYHTKT